MLDVSIRILAHILTPLFFVGLVGSAIVVLSKLGSDVVEFFANDSGHDTAEPHP